MELPAIEFGKRRPFIQGIVRDFETLHRAPDVPEQAFQIAQRLFRSFRWRDSHSQNQGIPLPSCFALWPVEPNDGALIVRFLDDGLDDQGRPHVLSVQAGYLGPNQIDFATLASVMQTQAWPPSTGDHDGDDQRLHLNETTPDREILSALSTFHGTKGRLPRVLVARNADYAFDLSAEVEILIGPPTMHLQELELPGHEGVVAAHSLTGLPSEIPAGSWGSIAGRRPPLRWPLTLGLSAVVGVMGYLANEIRSELDRLQLEQKECNSQIGVIRLQLESFSRNQSLRASSLHEENQAVRAEFQKQLKALESKVQNLELKATQAPHEANEWPPRGRIPKGSSRSGSSKKEADGMGSGT